jgi:hypothetical protein
MDFKPFYLKHFYNIITFQKNDVSILSLMLLKDISKICILRAAKRPNMIFVYLFHLHIHIL